MSAKRDNSEDLDAIESLSFDEVKDALRRLGHLKKCYICDSTD
jgi:hypothetical protein